MPRETRPWWIYQGLEEQNKANALSTALSRLGAPPPWRRFGKQARQDRGATFEPEPAEIDRVNAALLLRRPLLVTGRPGTGKTSLTYAVAHELGLEPVLRWSITSRTQLQDGLYRYLALVIDASPSMRLWRPTLAELYQLLARHGAFRDVRRWQLDVDARGKPVLSKGSANTPRYPEELLHPEGRRLVIVVSDYAAPPWYTGAYDRWLRLWSRNQPLALLHLLPPRFWLRGGLQRACLAQFRALAPGLPNPQLLPDIAVSVQPPITTLPRKRGGSHCKNEN